MKAADHSNQFSKELERVCLGKTSDFGLLYLSVPEFACGWYWAFGYVGNRNCHFHLNRLVSLRDDLRNKNLYDQMVNLFGDDLRVPRDNLWKFCEVVTTIYTLKSSAEMFGRGGSYYTRNPDAEKLQFPEYVTRINDELIPMQIRTLWDILNAK